jgi:sec-independent protein translocase protein TatA
MFGIGGGELIFIMFIALMLFGSDRIPEIARTMGKAMAQLKHATNDLKSEIQKGAEANGLDQTFRDLGANFTDVTANIDSEITKAKQNLLAEPTANLESAKGEVETAKQEFDDIVGPVKRQG